MRPHRGRRARWPHTRRRRAQRRYPGTRSLPGKCALCEDARVNIGAGLFGDGDVPAPPWPSRPGIDSIDPRGAASGHARPSLGARRSTRPAVRVSGVSPNAVSRCAFRFFPQLPQPQPHHRNGPLGFKNALSRVSPLNETAPRSNAKLRRVAEARNLVKRTNARFVRVDRRDPRAAHEARAARTRPPVLFVSITGTFSGSPGERYVPPPPMRPIEPPIPVRRLPSLPRCASGEIDPVSCSRSRRDRVADPAGRAPRRSAHAALVQRRDLFRPTEDAHREALTSSPQRAFPASSRTT